MTCEQPQCSWKGRNDRYEAHKKDDCLPQKILNLEACVANGAGRECMLCGIIEERDRVVAGQLAIIEEKDATIAALRKTVEQHLVRRRMRYFIDQMPLEEMLREAERMGVPARGAAQSSESTQLSPISEDEVLDVPPSPASRSRSRSRAPSRSPAPWLRPALVWRAR